MLFANRLVVSKISISPSSKSISILQKVSKLLVTRLAILNVGRFSFKSSSTCSIPIRQILILYYYKLDNSFDKTFYVNMQDKLIDYVFYCIEVIFDILDIS